MITIDIRDLEKVISRMGMVGAKVSNKSVLEVVALKIKERIYLRTQAGHDVNNTAFTPYNEKYKKSEGKTLVNMTKTGAMLKSMSQKVVSNDTAKVFFVSAHEQTKALRHIKGDNNMPQRLFFGVNSKDETNAAALYASEIAKVLNELN